MDYSITGWSPRDKQKHMMMVTSQVFTLNHHTFNQLPTIHSTKDGTQDDLPVGVYVDQQNLHESPEDQ